MRLLKGDRVTLVLFSKNPATVLDNGITWFGGYLISRL